MRKHRLLLADDHTLVLDGLQRILEPEFELVGMARDGYELLKVAPRVKPDVILLDISMPLMNGIEAGRQLRKIVPDSKLIYVTMYTDADYVTEAFRLGAVGYILKQSFATELVTAIHDVLQGRSYVTPLITKDMLFAFIQSPRENGKLSNSLTGRQREVLQLVAEGHSAKEIARILKMSPRTAEFHRSGVMKALGLHTTAELTKYAIQHGLIVM